MLCAIESMSEASFYKELEKTLREKRLTKKQLANLKIRLCSKHRVKKIPTDIEVLLNLKKVRGLKTDIQTKPTRSGSGVAIVAIMSKPYPCVHGKCIMCPGGIDSPFGTVPQSYTGMEPATMRAIRNKYDSYLQVINRLEQYVVMGHIPEKVELIIMGGTFISFPSRYKQKFIVDAFRAMNDFSNLFYDNGKKGRKGKKKQSKKKQIKLFNITKFKQFFELPGEVGCEKRKRNIHGKLNQLKKRKTTLEAEQKRNETANIRCVGLTFETRSDYAGLKHANEMLKFGATRVELGVQSVYDDVLRKIERGHGIKETTKAFGILKDLGFKINAHYMPGLTNKKRDLEGMKQLFSDERYKPDMLKIYPCMVVKGTKLYDIWKKKKFKPLTTEKAAELIAEFKKEVPSYVRIMRVQRDIASSQITAGVKRTNLRQYVDKIMKKNKWKCKCIRCREPKKIQEVKIRDQISINKIKPKIKSYKASNGREFFISLEDKNNIYGFCRLRFPSGQLREEITKDSALIRELHVYGTAAGISCEGKIQHKGFGKKLLTIAEEVANKNGKKKMVVISGIGAKEYYRKQKYKKEGVYMVKIIGNAT